MSYFGCLKLLLHWEQIKYKLVSVVIYPQVLYATICRYPPVDSFFPHILFSLAQTVAVSHEPLITNRFQLWLVWLESGSVAYSALFLSLGSSGITSNVCVLW